MAVAAPVREFLSRMADVEPRPQVARRAHMVTMLLGLWTMFGVFLDGWAHSTIIDTLEGFFTPWHAVLYSGFTAVAVWVSYQATRFQAKGSFDAAKIPTGYGLALIGVAIFGANAVGDAIWHTVFGVEEGAESLLSPTHLGLFVGMSLILTAPLRAAWHSDTVSAPSFRSFLPGLLSLALTTAGIAFFLMYLSPLNEQWARADWQAWAGRVGEDMIKTTQEHGVGGILASTVILLAPLLVALRRWELPFGSVTFVATIVGVGLIAMEGFIGVALVLSYVLGGLAADAAARRLRPGPDNVIGFRVFAAAVPAFVWSLYFGVMQVAYGVGWVVEFWAGAIVLSSIVGFALAYVMTLPAAPRVPGAAGRQEASSSTLRADYQSS